MIFIDALLSFVFLAVPICVIAAVVQLLRGKFRPPHPVLAVAAGVLTLAFCVYLCSFLNTGASRYHGTFAFFMILAGAGGLAAVLKKAPCWLVFVLLSAILIPPVVKLFRHKPEKTFFTDIKEYIYAQKNAVLIEACHEEARLSDKRRKNARIASVAKPRSVDDVLFFKNMEEAFIEGWFRGEDIYILVKLERGDLTKIVSGLRHPVEIIKKYEFRRWEYWLLRYSVLNAAERRKFFIALNVPECISVSQGKEMKWDLTRKFPEELKNDFDVEVYSAHGHFDGATYRLKPVGATPYEFKLTIRIFGADGMPAGQAETLIKCSKDKTQASIPPIFAALPEKIASPEVLPLQLPESYYLLKDSGISFAGRFGIKDPRRIVLQWDGNKTGRGSGKDSVPLPQSQTPYYLNLKYRVAGERPQKVKSKIVSVTPSAMMRKVKVLMFCSHAFTNRDFVTTLERICRKNNLSIDFVTAADGSLFWGYRSLSYKTLVEKPWYVRGLPKTSPPDPSARWKTSKEKPEAVLFLLGMGESRYWPEFFPAEGFFENRTTADVDRVLTLFRKTFPDAVLGVASPPDISTDDSIWGADENRTDGSCYPRKIRRNYNIFRNSLVKYMNKRPYGATLIPCDVNVKKTDEGVGDPRVKTFYQYDKNNIEALAENVAAWLLFTLGHSE